MMSLWDDILTEVETDTLKNFQNRKPVRVAKLWKKNLDSTTTIFHQRTFKTWRISSTASEIWELCDGSHTVNDILQILMRKFHEETTWDTVCKECSKFLIYCSKAKLIRWE